MNSVIIVAAGAGSRFGSNKMLADMKGKPLIWHTVNTFQMNSNINQIILVTTAEMKSKLSELFKGFFKLHITTGGETRTQSVFSGLSLVDRRCNLVAVHDGARPFVTDALIDTLFTEAKEKESAIPYIPVGETMYLTGENDANPIILNRDRAVTVQTPQVFDYRMLMVAYQSALGGNYTDDSQIFLRYYHKLNLVPGEEGNRKVTYARDLPSARVGCGTDVHSFSEKRKLILGGVQIPHTKGLSGHSDADVLVHAIMDALLSSIGERDIGILFPNKDPQYKDISSMVLLYKVWQLLEAKRAVIVNISATIIAEEPPLAPYIPQMTKNIAEILKISPTAVGISATTTEKLGLIGEGKGIAAQAVCSVEGLI